MGSSIEGPRLTRVEKSPNSSEGVFKNEQPTELLLPGTFSNTLANWLKGRQVRVPKQPIPIVRLEASFFEKPPASSLRITWLGHATALVEIDGYVLLTDPVFSQRPSPVSWVGPKRFHPPPIAIEDLPQLDAVVISHDHYDHLDCASIKNLESRTGRFFVPLGVGAHLESWGVLSSKIVELDWWEEEALGPGFELIATPSRHFSGRRLLDRDATLWSTWVISGPRHRVFFGGDTGLFEALSEIGARLGPFDVTLMPIGAYGATWPLIHLNPEQAVEAHLAVRGGLMIPIHWGTFSLALHNWTEPVQRLESTARAVGIDFFVPRPGQSVELGAERVFERWWPDLARDVGTREAGKWQEYCGWFDCVGS